jgi:hypothetical protein
MKASDHAGRFAELPASQKRVGECVGLSLTASEPSVPAKSMWVSG